MKTEVPTGVYATQGRGVRIVGDELTLACEALALVAEGESRIIETGVHLCLQHEAENGDEAPDADIVEAEAWLDPDEAEALAETLVAAAGIVREQLAIGTVLEDDEL